MQIITSKDNEIVKEVKKLKEKKYREQSNKFIVEGTRILEDAIAEKANIDVIIICEECIKNIDKKLMYEIAKYKCIYVSEQVFNTMTDVTNPQGILAVVNRTNNSINIDYTEDIIVVLDGIQDPGNLGTILRTVDSANLKQVVLSKQTADCYNPKVVRSTMGGIFRINVIQSEDIVKNLKDMKNNGFEIVVTSLDTETSVYGVDYTKKVIVIGNEANGVSKQVQDIADIKVKIPMLGKTESLNAAVATGVILYASVAAGIMIYEYVRKVVK